MDAGQVSRRIDIAVEIHLQLTSEHAAGCFRPGEVHSQPGFLGGQLVVPLVGPGIRLDPEGNFLVRGQPGIIHGVELEISIKAQAIPGGNAGHRRLGNRLSDRRVLFQTLGDSDIPFSFLLCQLRLKVRDFLGQGQDHGA